MAKFVCHKCDYPMRPMGKRMVCINPECGRSVPRKGRDWGKLGKYFENPNLQDVVK